MKKSKFYSLVFVALTFLTVNVYGQETKDELPTREKWNLVATQGTVTAVDKETREITLMGSKGDLVTITAGEEVKRFLVKPPSELSIAVNGGLSVRFCVHTRKRAEPGLYSHLSTALDLNCRKLKLGLLIS